MSELIAFHNDPKIKAKYLTRVRNHRKADNLVRGLGWDNGRGCAVGCTLEAYDHSRYPIELGVPQVLARLEDHMFESMEIEDAMKWPEEFLAAIPVGADLSGVWLKFAAWMLRQCIGFTENEEVQGVLDLVANLYESEVPFGDRRWHDAHDTAWEVRSRAYASAAAADASAAAAAAAAAAADAYAAADAAYAAADAAYAAADAADAAADAADADADAYAAAADAYAAAAARKKFWHSASRELLRLMSAAPVIG